MGYNASSPYTFYDQNNEIGKDGANTITNVGGGAVEAYGIYTRYQNNLKVANNTITSTTAGTKNIYGIYLTTANNASFDLYSNTVTIQFTPTDLFGNANFYGIYSCNRIFRILIYTTLPIKELIIVSTTYYHSFKGFINIKFFKP